MTGRGCCYRSCSEKENKLDLADFIFMPSKDVLACCFKSAGQALSVLSDDRGEAVGKRSRALRYLWPGLAWPLLSRLVPFGKLIVRLLPSDGLVLCIICLDGLNITSTRISKSTENGVWSKPLLGILTLNFLVYFSFFVESFMTT